MVGFTESAKCLYIRKVSTLFFLLSKFIFNIIFLFRILKC
jgi:hypothetical protein